MTGIATRKSMATLPPAPLQPVPGDDAMVAPRVSVTSSAIVLSSASIGIVAAVWSPQLVSGTGCECEAVITPPSSSGVHMSGWRRWPAADAAVSCSFSRRRSSVKARCRLAVGHSGLGGGGGGTAARQGKVLDVDVVTPPPPIDGDVDSVKQLAALSSAADGERVDAMTTSPPVVGLMPFTFSRRGAAPPGTIR